MSECGASAPILPASDLHERARERRNRASRARVLRPVADSYSMVEVVTLVTGRISPDRMAELEDAYRDVLQGGLPPTPRRHSSSRQLTIGLASSACGTAVPTSTHSSPAAKNRRRAD
jgi:hypothetical protein